MSNPGDTDATPIRSVGQLADFIAAGCKPGDFTHIAVVADTAGPVSPCGACRQVMHELGGPTLLVVQCNLRGNSVLATAAQLLPGAFTLDPV